MTQPNIATPQVSAVRELPWNPETAFTGAPGKIHGYFFLLGNASHGPQHQVPMFVMLGGLA